MRALALFLGVWLCLLAGCGGGSGGSSGKSISLSITPTSAALSPGGQATFMATVTNTTNTAVTWSVQEGATGGTITSAGVYTAPATTGAFHVVATSQADTSIKAAVLVEVTQHVVITISPTSANVAPGGSITFTATVTGTTNTAVAWRVQEGTGGGTITAGGVYTPAATSGTFHVVAISQADTTQQAVATVTIQSGSATGTIN